MVLTSWVIALWLVHKLSLGLFSHIDFVVVWYLMSWKHQNISFVCFDCVVISQRSVFQYLKCRFGHLCFAFDEVFIRFFFSPRFPLSGCGRFCPGIPVSIWCLIREEISSFFILNSRGKKSIWYLDFSSNAFLLEVVDLFKLNLVQCFILCNLLTKNLHGIGWLFNFSLHIFYFIKIP